MCEISKIMFPTVFHVTHVNIHFLSQSPIKGIQHCVNNLEGKTEKSFFFCVCVCVCVIAFGVI